MPSPKKVRDLRIESENSICLKFAWISSTKEEKFYLLSYQLEPKESD